MSKKSMRKAWTDHLGDVKQDQVVKPKYKNQPMEADGHKFASKKERNRYFELKLMRLSHDIHGLLLQPRYPIEIGGIKVRFASGRQLTYVADFEYWDVKLGRLVVEDVKGMKTQVYKIKKALMAAMGYTITEI